MGDIINFKQKQKEKHVKKIKKSHEKLEFEIEQLKIMMRRSLSEGFSKKAVFEIGIQVYEDNGVHPDVAFDIVLTLMGEII